MQEKEKQNKLHGIPGFVGFRDLVFDLVDRHGLQALAAEIGTDPSKLSRFKNEQEGLTLPQIERLLAFAGVRFMDSRRYNRMMITIITLNEFLKESLGL
ncbi:MAG: hypothetical protein AB1457_16140 [Chloroflexota bacterium]